MSETFNLKPLPSEFKLSSFFDYNFEAVIKIPQNQKPQIQASLVICDDHPEESGYLQITRYQHTI